MRYYITEEDIDMVINKWDDEWKTLVLSQEILERKTEEATGQGETQPKEIQVPKRQRMGQGRTTQIDKGTTKIGPQNRKKYKA
jgi:hypothetical protein